MTVPTSPIQGKSVTSDSGNKEGENNLFDSLLEMYLSPDKLAKSNALLDGLSGKKANEISEEKIGEQFEGKFDEKSIDLIKAISNLNSEEINLISFRYSTSVMQMTIHKPKRISLSNFSCFKLVLLFKE